jgi:alanyl-tRNA synthetase
MLGPNTAKTGKFNMGKFIKGIVNDMGGSGGGKADFGSGFIAKKVASKDNIEKYVRKALSKED